jgi:hypothetical protein
MDDVIDFVQNVYRPSAVISCQLIRNNGAGWIYHRWPNVVESIPLNSTNVVLACEYVDRIHRTVTIMNPWDLDLAELNSG